MILLTFFFKNMLKENVITLFSGEGDFYLCFFKHLLVKHPWTQGSEVPYIQKDFSQRGHHVFIAR